MTLYYTWIDIFKIILKKRLNHAVSAFVHFDERTDLTTYCFLLKFIVVMPLVMSKPNGVTVAL